MHTNNIARENSNYKLPMLGKIEWHGRSLKVMKKSQQNYFYFTIMRKFRIVFQKYNYFWNSDRRQFTLTAQVLIDMIWMFWLLNILTQPVYRKVWITAPKMWHRTPERFDVRFSTKNEIYCKNIHCSRWNIRQCIGIDQAVLGSPDFASTYVHYSIQHA